MIAHPDSADALRKLGKAELGGNDWRAAISALARLGGKAAAQTAVGQADEPPAQERVARAAGGGVRVQKMDRAAISARREIAAASVPLMHQPDEAVAAALRLADRYR